MDWFVFPFMNGAECMGLGFGCVNVDVWVCGCVGSVRGVWGCGCWCMYVFLEECDGVYVEGG